MPKEEIEKVQLRSAPAVEKPTIPSGAALPQPSWAVETKLGDVEKRFVFFLLQIKLNFI